MKFSASLVKLYEIFENSYFREPPRYGAPFLKKKDFFAHKLSFWGRIILLLSTWILLSTTSTCFCRIQITFCATSNFLFQHKMSFLFRTSLRMLCHGDIFLFSHSNKNIITCQKINKLSFLCETKKLVSFLCASQFFCITVFRLHIVGKLIFFVVVLETKKLLIHVLLTCLIIVIKTER